MKWLLNHSIIGCGRIAQNHYNAATLNNMQVTICCDKDINKARQFAEKNSIEQFTDNYFDVIRLETVDSVSICTDHYSHIRIAQDLIKYKHLVIEKPLSTNMLDATSFTMFSKKFSNTATVITQHRFDRTVVLVKKMLEDVAFGKISLVNVHLKCYRDFEYYSKSYWRGVSFLEGGSSVINQAYHLIDILSYFFGLPLKIESFQTNVKYKGIIETEDTCVAILDYGEFLCNFSSTNTSITDWRTSIEIIGTEGEISFTLDFPEKILEMNVMESVRKRYFDCLTQINYDFLKNQNTGVNYYGLSHIKQFENFRNSVLKNEQLKVTLEDALITLKIISMIYKNG